MGNIKDLNLYADFSETFNFDILTWVVQRILKDIESFTKEWVSHGHLRKLLMAKADTDNVHAYQGKLRDVLDLFLVCFIFISRPIFSLINGIW